MSIRMIGLDTAKSIFQVHAVDETGRMVIRRKLQRSEVIAFFKMMLPTQQPFAWLPLVPTRDS